jgi:hypothetical protein
VCNLLQSGIVVQNDLEHVERAMGECTGKKVACTMFRTGKGCFEEKQREQLREVFVVGRLRNIVGLD